MKTNNSVKRASLVICLTAFLGLTISTQAANTATRAVTPAELQTQTQAEKSSFSEALKMFLHEAFGKSANTDVTPTQQLWGPKYGSSSTVSHTTRSSSSQSLSAPSFQFRSTGALPSAHHVATPTHVAGEYQTHASGSASASAFSAEAFTKVVQGVGGGFISGGGATYASNSSHTSTVLNAHVTAVRFPTLPLQSTGTLLALTEETDGNTSIARLRKIGEGDGFEDEDEPDKPGEPMPLGEGVLPLLLMAMTLCVTVVIRRRKATSMLQEK